MKITGTHLGAIGAHMNDRELADLWRMRDSMNGVRAPSDGEPKTVMGVPIVINPVMGDYTIEFRDKDGNAIGRIVNLGRHD